MFNDQEKEILERLGDLFQIIRYNIKTCQSIKAIDLLISIHNSYNTIRTSSKFNEEKKAYFKDMYLNRISLLVKEATDVDDGQVLKRLSELTF